jgi:hypothetical protein
MDHGAVLVFCVAHHQLVCDVSFTHSRRTAGRGLRRIAGFWHTRRLECSPDVSSKRFRGAPAALAPARSHSVAPSREPVAALSRSVHWTRAVRAVLPEPHRDHGQTGRRRHRTAFPPFLDQLEKILSGV